MKFFPLLIVWLLLSSCSDQPTYQVAPSGLSIAGTWAFESQDEESFKVLLSALNYVPIGFKGLRNSEFESKRNLSTRFIEEKTLRDQLVGLLTLVPKELYIEQTKKQVSIDFGVAGYHTFNIAEQTELIIDGIEIIAYAGWEDNDFKLRLGRSSSYQLVEKFRVINKTRLVETIELEISGRAQPLIHKRYYKLL